MISDLREKKSKTLEYFLERLLQGEVKNSIGKIILFGSFSRDKIKEGSDIDLLIFVPGQLDEVGDACDTASFETAVQFGEPYVKTKIISDEVGRALRHSLRLRNSVRYEPHARIAKEDAEKIMDLANSLLKLLRQEL